MAKVTKSEDKAVVLKTVKLDEKVSVVLYSSGSLHVVYNGYSPCRRSTITPEAIGALIKTSVQNQLADLANDSMELKAAKPAKVSKPSSMTDEDFAEFQDYKAWKASRAKQA